jgi:hypothetical protein
MTMKRLAALLVAPAAVAALVVPAGASTPTTWVHQTLPCATGHKSASLVQKWQGDHAVKTWVDNPCRAQWLYLAWDISSSRLNVVDVAPRHHAQIGGSVTPDSFELHVAKTCSFGDVFVSQVGAKQC